MYKIVERKSILFQNVPEIAHRVQFLTQNLTFINFYILIKHLNKGGTLRESNAILKFKDKFTKGKLFNKGVKEVL